MSKFSNWCIFLAKVAMIVIAASIILEIVPALILVIIGAIVIMRHPEKIEKLVAWLCKEIES